MSLILKNQGRTTQSRGPTLPGARTTASGPLVMGPPATPVGKAPPLGSTQTTNPAPPPVPAPPSSTVTPDPNLIARQQLLDRKLADTNSQLDESQTATRQAYGWDDTSNPFSQAALLKLSYTNRQRGTTNSSAARGQLYSGAYGNQQAIDTRGYDQSSDASRRAFDAAMRNIANQRTNAQTAHDEGNLDAIDTSTQAALNQLPDPSAIPQQDLSTTAPQSAPKTLSTAAQKRRAKRAAAGVKDVRGLSPAAIKSLRARGYLPG